MCHRDAEGSGMDLSELSSTVRAVAEAVGPSVVGLGAATGRGSGVVVAPGRLLTNAHNLRGSGGITVTFADGRRADGQVAGADLDGDLAVVAVDTGDAPPVPWPAGTAAPRLGDAVLTLADPYAQGPTVTVGLVAATGQRFRGPRGRLLTDAVAHTAPLARGSSGGPLLSPQGELVGLNTHRRGEGFYLALPATDELRARADALGRGERPARPRLGVAVAPPRLSRSMRAAVGLSGRDGVLVRAVDPDGPAGRAGVRRGDLIVAVGGEPVTGPDVLSARIEAAAPDGAVRLGVVRGTDELDIDVTVGPEEVTA